MQPLLQPLNRGVLYACGLLAGLIFLTRLSIVVSHNADFSGCESNVIYGMQRILAGEPLYSDTKTIPYAIIQYTPLYYHLCTTTARALGFGAGDIYPLYLIGRLWNLLFNLGTMWIVFRIARRLLNLPLSWAWLIAMLNFGFEYYQNFAVRGDSLQDLFAFGSIWFFLRFILADFTSPALWRCLLPAVALSACSAFSKQSGVQLPLIFGGYLLLAGRWKPLGWTILFAAFAFGLPLAWELHRSPWFLQNVVGGVSNGFNLENFYDYILLKKYFLLTGIPLAAYVVWRTVRDNGLFRGSPVSRFLYCLACGTLGFATLTGLKSGATVQYYFLFVNAAMWLLFCRLAASATTAGGVLQGLGLYAAGCLAVYLVWNVKLVKLINYTPEAVAQREEAGKVAAYLAAELGSDTTKYFFADLTIDPSVFPARQQINNVLFRQAAVPQLDVLHYATIPVKALGYENFEADLAGGRIAYVVESRPVYPVRVSPRYDSLLRANYSEVQRIGGYAIFRHQRMQAVASVAARKPI